MQNYNSKLIIFTGPSGVGKGTILKDFFNKAKKNCDKIIYSISSTTRAPREGEVDGVHYFFISREEFKKDIEENMFLEWAEYSGNYYGTSKKFVEKNLKAGNSVLLEIELQGALNIMRAFPDALSIFIMPPSFEELERRLRGRNSEDNETIIKRLNTAKTELSNADKFKYKIINNNVDEAVEELYKIYKGETK